MQDYHPISTPTDTHYRLIAAIPVDTIMDVPYKEAIGCLLYLALLTYADISYVVSTISKFLERSIASHW